MGYRDLARLLDLNINDASLRVCVKRRETHRRKDLAFLEELDSWRREEEDRKREDEA